MSLGVGGNRADTNLNLEKVLRWAVDFVKGLRLRGGEWGLHLRDDLDVRVKCGCEAVVGAGAGLLGVRGAGGGVEV